MGEALKEMSEVKYALEDNVKQNFLEPLTHLQAKDLKDVLVCVCVCLACLSLLLMEQTRGGDARVDFNKTF